MFSKLRPLIFKVDPEKAHTLAIKSLKFNLVPNVFDENKNDPILQTKIFDKEFVRDMILKLPELTVSKVCEKTLQKGAFYSPPPFCNHLITKIL